MNNIYQKTKWDDKDLTNLGFEIQEVSFNLAKILVYWYWLINFWCLDATFSIYWYCVICSPVSHRLTVIKFWGHCAGVQILYSTFWTGMKCFRPCVGLKHYIVIHKNSSISFLDFDNANKFYWRVEMPFAVKHQTHFFFTTVSIIW